MLCLSMIVKNEAKIIARCLNSVKKYISSYTIHDTGSTDNTVDIIRDTLKDIPGKITSVPFLDFSHNRNLALEDAKTTKCDYILLIDADMELKVSDEDFVSKLKADVYSVYQKNKTIKYSNTRIVKNGIYSKYVGSTHEYVDHLGSLELTDMIYMIDHDDGGCKKDKFIRDEMFLKRDIEKKEDPRSYFYLGKTLKALKKYEEAIKVFEKRISLGGWAEETWYSRYMIMETYFEKKEIEKAVYNGFLAYNMRPTRSEPLVHLAKYFRETKCRNIAYDICLMGKKILYPKDILFVEHSAYWEAFDYELSIISFYLGKIDLGLEMSNKLLLSNYNKYHVQRNLKFYLPNLEDKMIKHKELSSLEDNYNICNPSLYWDGKILNVNLRHVNYCYENNVPKHIDKSKTGGFNTLNYRLFLDLNLEEKKSFRKFECKDTSSCIKHDSYANGFEDMRIFEYNNDIWYVATCIQMNKTPQMVLGNSKKVIPLLYKTTNCEKNWLPFIHKDKILLIYGYKPFEILSVDIESGKCSLYNKPDIAKIHIDNFRGSCIPKKYKNGYIFAIHEVFDNNGRFYYFRLVIMDSKLNITKVSLPFRMNSRYDIQYLMGLEIIENKIYMSWGEEDKKAYVGILSMDILKFLFP